MKTDQEIQDRLELCRRSNDGISEQLRGLTTSGEEFDSLATVFNENGVRISELEWVLGDTGGNR